MRTRTQLLGVVDRLARQNSGSMSDMAAPVGKTVTEVRQFPANQDPIVIDAPTAEALRSQDEIVVGDLQEFRGVVVALDTKTGTFKIEEDESGRELRGKITDPALSLPNNIYSHALDEKISISLIAKPTMKSDGSIHKLFVSDARP